VTGQSEDDILRMKRKDFIELIKELHFLSDLCPINRKWPKYFSLRGRIFKPLQRVEDLTGGQYADLSTFCRNAEDIIPNLHKILAVLCLPVKWGRVKEYDGRKHKELSEFFYRHLTIDIAYPMAFFFCKVWESLMPDIAQVLEKEAQSLTTMIREAKTLNPQTLSSNISDGYTPSTSSPEGTYSNGSPS
jgi:hypothetical protein